MFYLYFSLFNKNIHEVKNIAIRIVSCHTYRDTYRIVKMCIVTSLMKTRTQRQVWKVHHALPVNFPLTVKCVSSLTERKLQSICLFQVVDDAIESSYKIVTDTFDFFIMKL